MPTIAIISQKGGSGKTTLALHLAAAAQAAGIEAVLIDTDPQATASQWGAWRKDAPPEVIDSPPPRLAAKIEQVRGRGAQLVVIDTPPHTDTAASAAVDLADLTLIPCRPSAFDLAAIQTTARLIQLRRKPAFVVFNGGSPNAPKLYEETAEMVAAFGLSVCPFHLADRAAYRHATGGGKSVLEIEPNGKAAEEVRQLYTWICEQVRMPTRKQRRTAA